MKKLSGTDRDVQEPGESERPAHAACCLPSDVAPQIAQQIIRHSNYKTTLKHYTVPGLTDTAKAIEELTRLGTPAGESVEATGTNDPTPIGNISSTRSNRSTKPCEQVRTNAADRNTV
jgi:hypothetical protein